MSEARRLKAFEDENRRLKKLLAAKSIVRREGDLTEIIKDFSEDDLQD